MTRAVNNQGDGTFFGREEVLPTNKTQTPIYARMERLCDAGKPGVTKGWSFIRLIRPTAALVRKASLHTIPATDCLTAAG